MNGDLTYGGNSLQTYNHDTRTGIITNFIDHTNTPEQEAELFTKADANGSSIPSINYSSKKVSIAGSIHGSTQADLDTRIDTFKSYFNGKDKNLDITYAGSTRRYIATKNAISIERSNTSLVARFTISFICTNPFGVDVASTNIINVTGHTTATLTVQPTIGGSAEYQLPKFTITVNSKTGTGDYIQITNNQSDQKILVYGQGLTTGSVLVIDCENRKVTLNGTEVDYSGTFLELKLGAADLTYSDGFTTRDVNIVAEYTKRYN